MMPDKFKEICAANFIARFREHVDSIIYAKNNLPGITPYQCDLYLHYIDKYRWRGHGLEKARKMALSKISRVIVNI